MVKPLAENAHHRQAFKVVDARPYLVLVAIGLVLSLLILCVTKKRTKISPNWIPCNRGANEWELAPNCGGICAGEGRPDCLKRAPKYDFYTAPFFPRRPLPNMIAIRNIGPHVHGEYEMDGDCPYLCPMDEKENFTCARCEDNQWPVEDKVCGLPPTTCAIVEAPPSTCARSTNAIPQTYNGGANARPSIANALPAPCGRSSTAIPPSYGASTKCFRPQMAHQSEMSVFPTRNAYDDTSGTHPSSLGADSYSQSSSLSPSISESSAVYAMQGIRRPCLKRMEEEPIPESRRTYGRRYLDSSTEEQPCKWRSAKPKSRSSDPQCRRSRTHRTPSSDKVRKRAPSCPSGRERKRDKRSSSKH